MARKTIFYIQGLIEQQWTNIASFMSSKALEAEKIRRLKERQLKLPCRIFCSRTFRDHFSASPKRDNHTRIMYENVGVLNDMLDELESPIRHQFLYSLRLHVAPYDSANSAPKSLGHLGLYTRYQEDSPYQNVANVNCDLKSTSIDFVLQKIKSATPDIKQMVRMAIEDHITFESEQCNLQQV